MKCEAYPLANGSSLSLDCNVTIDNTFTKKNEAICQYEIITESKLTRVNANNTFNDACFPNCQMKTINLTTPVDLPLNITTKSDAKNTTYILPITDYRKICKPSFVTVR